MFLIFVGPVFWMWHATNRRICLPGEYYCAVVGAVGPGTLAVGGVLLNDVSSILHSCSGTLRCLRCVPIVSGCHACEEILECDQLDVGCAMWRLMTT